MGKGMDAIRALNIALATGVKRDPDTFNVGTGFYKDTPAASSSLGPDAQGLGVKVALQFIIATLCFQLPTVSNDTVHGADLPRRVAVV